MFGFSDPAYATHCEVCGSNLNFGEHFRPCRPKDGVSQ